MRLHICMDLPEIAFKRRCPLSFLIRSFLPSIAERLRGLPLLDSSWFEACVGAPRNYSARSFEFGYVGDRVAALGSCRQDRLDNGSC